MRTRKLRTVVSVVAGIATMAVLACSSQEDPFEIDQLREIRQATPAPTAVPTVVGDASAVAPTVVPVSEGTPEPTPTVHTVGEATAAAFRKEQEAKESGETAPTPLALDRQSDQHIKMANWPEKNINLANFIVGYILSHGYEYDIELVELESAAYQDGLQKGDFDIVLLADQGWVQQSPVTEVIVDVGSLYETKPTLRIGVNRNIGTRAPEVIQLLGLMKPGDEILSEIEGSLILSGFLGLLPNVAALKYLKENEEIWTLWVSPEAVQKIKDAIAGGKTKFERRAHQVIDSA